MNERMIKEYCEALCSIPLWKHLTPQERYRLMSIWMTEYGRSLGMLL